jgi:hypothetical protein
MLAYDLFSYNITVFRELSVNCTVSKSCFSKLKIISCLHMYAAYIVVMVTAVHGPVVLSF